MARRGVRRKKIYELIKKRETMSLEQIRSLTDVNYNTIRSSVIKLTNEGFIERVGRGIYKIKRK